MFTPAERAKVTGILRDFGLTAAGNSTIPENLGSKYLLPVSALGMGPAGVTQLPGGKTTTTSGISDSAGNDSLISKALMVSPILSMVAENSVYKDLNAQANKGILAATPAGEVTPLSFLTNAIKGVARAGLGFPMGVYALATDPVGTGKAMLKDYGKRYGALWGDPDSNFIASTLEDPTVPILDVLGLVPIVGAGAKVSRPLVNNINVDAGFQGHFLAFGNRQALVCSAFWICPQHALRRHDHVLCPLQPLSL
jgi:hypothetical protein